MSVAFRHQEMKLLFEPDTELPVRVRSIASGAAPDPDLNVNALLTRDDVVVLQSPTASTLVEINANTASVRTLFYGDFLAPQCADKRNEYLRAKSDKLFRVLDAAGARYSFFGLVTVARCSAAIPEEQARLRAAVRKMVPGIEVLSEGEELQDFNLRVARAPDEIRYSNLSVAWYQERTISMNLDQVPTGGMRVPDWTMPISDEGVEIRFDQNNKQALNRGRRDWSSDDLRSIVASYGRELSTAIDRIVKYLV